MFGTAKMSEQSVMYFFGQSVVLYACRRSPVDWGADNGDIQGRLGSFF